MKLSRTDAIPFRDAVRGAHVAGACTGNGSLRGRVAGAGEREQHHEIEDDDGDPAEDVENRHGVDLAARFFVVRSHAPSGLPAARSLAALAARVDGWLAAQRPYARDELAVAALPIVVP